PRRISGARIVIQQRLSRRRLYVRRRLEDGCHDRACLRLRLHASVNAQCLELVFSLPCRHETSCAMRLSTASQYVSTSPRNSSVPRSNAARFAGSLTYGWIALNTELLWPTSASMCSSQKKRTPSSYPVVFSP